MNGWQLKKRSSQISHIAETSRKARRKSVPKSGRFRDQVNAGTPENLNSHGGAFRWSSVVDAIPNHARHGRGDHDRRPHVDMAMTCYQCGNQSTHSIWLANGKRGKRCDDCKAAMAAKRRRQGQQQVKRLLDHLAAGRALSGSMGEMDAGQ